MPISATIGHIPHGEESRVSISRCTKEKYMTLRRALGRSGIEVSALGMGCWAIGGPFLLDGKPDGWGAINDCESIRASQRAIELGITFFDTADVYGTGHSETVLGQAIAGRRNELIIATKFGYTYDAAGGAITGTKTTPGYIRWA